MPQSLQSKYVRAQARVDEIIVQTRRCASPSDQERLALLLWHRARRDQSFLNDLVRIACHRLAERLGMRNPHGIRQIISKNKKELEGFGGFSAKLINPTTLGGRPGREFWLNEGQALCVCILSRAPNASAVRQSVIRVYMEWRHNRMSTVGADRLASLESEVQALREREVVLIKALLNAKPRWAKVIRYLGMGLGKKEIGRLSGCSDRRIHDDVQRLTGLGLLPEKPPKREVLHG
ncbi:hypothetical protein CCP2SC5_1040011 [Azospirillaceae bacterium]